MKTLFNFIFVLFTLIGLLSCGTTDPQIPVETKPTLSLSVEDTSCTEAWVKLTTQDLTLPAELILKQYNQSGDSLSQIFVLNTKDSLLYIDSLLQNQTYKLQVSSIEDQVSGNKLTVSTMDTTSHERTWQLFYFGEHSHSFIRDIAIINENDIWAVGEIYMNDSLGNPDANRYNAVKWDGTNWTVIRIPYKYEGETYYNPIQSVFEFNSEDVWFCGNGIIHWDGTYFWAISIPSRIWGPYDINKIWGSSKSDLYIVGNQGKIAHYNGTNWSSMESGTTVDLLDIWGASDGTLWASGYSGDYGTTVLLRNSGSGWVKVFEGSSFEQNNGYNVGPISGIWSTNKYRIYLMNNTGVFYQENNDQLFLRKEIIDFSRFSYDISGTDDNDIYVSGSRFIGHWNGISYREYPELYQENRDYYSIKTKGNTVCSGGTDYNGFSYSQAVIAIGTKN